MAKTKKSVAVQSPLESAMAFLSLAHAASCEQSIFAFVELGNAQCYNLVQGLGIPIHEDLAACPQIGLLLAAVERCGSSYAITQLSTSKLLVRSGEFHAYIPCYDPDSFVLASPDAPQGILGEAFMLALEKVAGLAVTTGERVIDCSIQLNDGSVIATNSSVIIEAWHGFAFPNGLLMPKTTYNILKKAKKKIVKFGFSDKSVTFYFSDESWLYTKLYQDRWPDVQKRLNLNATLREVHPDFFAAVRKVQPFSSDGHVWVEGNKVSSHPFDAKEVGSALSLTFSGSPHAPRIYGATDLKTISKHALKWDEEISKSGTYFVGDDLRGLIYHAPFVDLDSLTDEDIPF